jgi:hypothetical protein
LSEVKIQVTFASAEKCGLDSFEASIYCDYAYLDAPERNLFNTSVSKGLDFLVETVQIQELRLPDDIYSETTHSRYDAKLNFRRPIKSLHWIIRHEPEETPTDTDTRTHHGRYVGDPDNTYLSFSPCPWTPSQLGLVQSISEKLAPIHQASLTFNGSERISPRNGVFFNTVQNLRHKLGCALPGIYSYSLSLYPSQLEPSGAASFTMLDDVILHLTMKKNTTAEKWQVDEDTGIHLERLKTLIVFAWGYNILHVQSGTATMVY